MAANANEIRDTPGRLLLGWALLFTSLVLLSWRIHLRPADYEWTEYPTALGDTKYYTTLGKDDRYEPNLRYAGHDEGVFRRAVEPVELEDAQMLKIAQDATGKHFVYRPDATAAAAAPTASEKGPLPVYLKSGENRYVEFGERKFYVPYEPKVGP